MFLADMRCTLHYYFRKKGDGPVFHYFNGLFLPLAISFLRNDKEADLPASWKRAWLPSACLALAKLAPASLPPANLSPAILSPSILPPANLSPACLPHVKL
jgi:hypothetical protein